MTPEAAIDPTLLSGPPFVEPPDPSDIAERAAIIAEGDNVSPDEADARALAEYGLMDFKHFANAWRLTILAGLDVIAPPTGIAAKLEKSTREFVGSSFMVDAVRHGWSLKELFGFPPGEVSSPHHATGLVPALALTPYAGGQKIVGIGRNGAAVMNQNGATLTHPRGRSGLDDDGNTPWWLQPAFAAAQRRAA